MQIRVMNTFAKVCKFTHTVLSGVHVARSLVSYIVSCRSLFILFSFSFWLLCCLFIFDLWRLITPLVSLKHYPQTPFFKLSSSSVLFPAFILCSSFADRKLTEPVNISITCRPHYLNSMYSQFNYVFANNINGRSGG